LKVGSPTENFVVLIESLKPGTRFVPWSGDTPYQIITGTRVVDLNTGEEKDLGPGFLCYGIVEAQLPDLSPLYAGSAYGSPGT
jgi:hypothetical protein